VRLHECTEVDIEVEPVLGPNACNYAVPDFIEGCASATVLKGKGLSLPLDHDDKPTTSSIPRYVRGEQPWTLVELRVEIRKPGVDFMLRKARHENLRA